MIQTSLSKDLQEAVDFHHAVLAEGSKALVGYDLAKAVAIGQQLTQQTETIDLALADGATEAHLLGENAFVRPTSGRLTSVFGARWGTSHYGIDIANRIGTPIYAFTDGVVAEAGPASGFGLWVVLKHPDGTSSVYGHVNRMFVQKGQSVKAGEEIAEIAAVGMGGGRDH